MKTPSAQLVLVSNANLQSSTLLHYLHSKVGVAISLFDISNDQHTVLNLDKDRIIFLIDLSAIKSISEMDSLIFAHINHKQTVLLNSDQPLETEELTSWPNLVGIFQSSDRIETVAAGLEKILLGENWLSRKVLGQLLAYYQNESRIQSYHPPTDIELTRRETEILQTLKEGASNLEIADRLFISEHTIKSHLYNIFKKLEVRNRLQAMAWAKQHLC
ncbi:LuxR C-terminal-related transcriptional regulator [Aliivibrio kagoshimensis]|jgi:DNA-binding NarL/FixJ family response regulator|uniref:LuxR C-terminal-related transcriptional regulator n=1 Tax=Aliivibrio kagoshimensis TaxID=2910230 RepID=UPI003D0FA64D